MAQYSLKWCVKCARWVVVYTELTVIRCPYCNSDLTVTNLSTMPIPDLPKGDKYETD